MFVRTQTNGDRTYLIVVENERIGGKIRQRVLHRLGRLDELRASGQLDALISAAIATLPRSGSNHDRGA